MNSRKREKRHWRERLNALPDKLEDYQKPQTETPKEERPGERRPMTPDERAFLVEQRIQEAMAQGAFDNLPGQGKPLDLKKNPYLEPGMELAYNLLQNNGFAPEWIERDKSIRKELDTIRRRLQAAWQQRRGKPNHEARWQAAVADFTQRLAKLNRQIDDFNLVVPILSLQRSRLQLEDELQRAKTE
jgi:DnaJ family protein C protein 28